MLILWLTVDVHQYCPVHRNKVIQDPDNCAKFYNCSDVSHSECTYPDLFSLVTFRCERFLSTSCDQRPEPQAPCNAMIFFLFCCNVEVLSTHWKIINYKIFVFSLRSRVKKSKDKSNLVYFSVKYKLNYK